MMCGGACTHAPVCKGQDRMSGIFFNCFLPYGHEIVSFIEPAAHCRLAAQQTLNEDFE